jgi:nitroreductase
MEFSEVVRRRRMVRRYSPEPVDRAVLDRVLRNALHAPSAGYSQGWAFLVLDEPADVERFWDVTAAEELESPDAWLRGMTTAPVVIVPLSSKELYLDRYAEPDKGWTDKDEESWPVPYWHLDTAMASLLMLLTAVDEGLGACFFGVEPEQVDALRDAFGVPATYTPIGAITLGHRTEDPDVAGSANRGRKPLEEVVHRGRWRSSPPSRPS